jgi:hypothetical protein
MTDPALTPEHMIEVAGNLRDELTHDQRWPSIYPMALDVIASTPALATRFVRALLNADAGGMG